MYTSFIFALNFCVFLYYSHIFVALYCGVMVAETASSRFIVVLSSALGLCCRMSFIVLATS